LADGSDAVMALAVISEQSELKLISGKRTLTLKAADIEHYSGARAKRGLHLPRGFQKVDSFVVE
ncbi:MAG TPA: hypothetical protein DCZ48_05835, partial [Methylococcaceae bacterium]|nr:hypothetical protein [Methylococcaceae bacterium]